MTPIFGPHRAGRWQAFAVMAPGPALPRLIRGAGQSNLPKVPPALDLPLLDGIPV